MIDILHYVLIDTGECIRSTDKILATDPSEKTILHELPSIESVTLDSIQFQHTKDSNVVSWLRCHKDIIGLTQIRIESLEYYYV